MKFISFYFTLLYFYWTQLNTENKKVIFPFSKNTDKTTDPICHLFRVSNSILHTVPETGQDNKSEGKVWNFFVWEKSKNFFCSQGQIKGWWHTGVFLTNQEGWQVCTFFSMNGSSLTQSMCFSHWKSTIVAIWPFCLQEGNP